MALTAQVGAVCLVYFHLVYNYLIYEIMKRNPKSKTGIWPPQS